MVKISYRFVKGNLVKMGEVEKSVFRVERWQEVGLEGGLRVGLEGR